MRTSKIDGGWSVSVDPDELVVRSGRRLPYATTIGTIDRRGKINVWTPAGSKPQGYRKAAQRLLEEVRLDLYTRGEMGERPLNPRDMATAVAREVREAGYSAVPSDNKVFIDPSEGVITIESIGDGQIVASPSGGLRRFPDIIAITQRYRQGPPWSRIGKESGRASNPMTSLWSGLGGGR